MKTPVVQPYLFFGGRCDEALEFYKRAVGATVQMVMRYNESPQPMPPGSIPPGFENKVMHATISIGDSIVMMSDGNEKGAKFDGFSLSISLPTEADANRVFAALSEGGSVTMPLAKTFWSPRFGMLQDRFGIGWMVAVAV